MAEGMKGGYKDCDRAAARQDFLFNHVPAYIRDEIAPLDPYLTPREGIIALDVGANKGFWAKALLSRHGNRVKHIHMFDASPENFSELTEVNDSLMFENDDFSRLSAYHFAIGDKTGLVDLFTNDDGSPVASLYSHEYNGNHLLNEMGALKQRIEVPMQTLDNIIDILKIPHVDILKLDIEGHEYKALLGAERSIAHGKISIIAFEFGIHQVESRNFFKDFHAFFSKYDYKLFKSDKSGDGQAFILYPVEEYSYSYENLSWCWNYIAVKY